MELEAGGAAGLSKGYKRTRAGLAAATDNHTMAIIGLELCGLSRHEKESSQGLSGGKYAT
jgi:hypothetical protein